MGNRYDTVEDFIADNYFRQWVKNPDASSTQYWQAFLAKHPEQAETVRLAAEAVRKLSDATAALSEPANPAEEAVIWNAISAHLLGSEKQSGSPFVTRYRGTGWNWFLAAASVLVVLGSGWWLQHIYSSGKVSAGIQTAVVQKPQLSIERTNSTEKPQLLTLPDGSSILLQKGSQLRYPSAFSGSKRIVFLTGEAFFEVAKDPARPFLVYASGLVTKVLGTSFNIKAYTTDKDVVVTVRSGRVAVFTQSDKKQRQKISSPSLDGVVLIRNQQLVFLRQEVRLTTPKVITPAVARSVFAVNPTTFQFDATPVSEVFAQLEKVYGINVVYDKETLGKCRLTADLTDEPLANKMLIICKSIEATYTIADTQLTVSGPGCGS